MIFPTKTKDNYKYIVDNINISDLSKIKISKQEEYKKVFEDKILDTYYGDITAYGIDCEGCIGITASGFDVRNTITYKDKEYGNISIVAADSSIPFGTIIRISNNDIDIISIVLDRGGAIGFNNGALIDLLLNSEEECYDFGRKKAKVEVLRYGY